MEGRVWVFLLVLWWVSCFKPAIFSAHREGNNFLLAAKADVDKITKLLSHSSFASGNTLVEGMTAQLAARNSARTLGSCPAVRGHG